MSRISVERRKVPAKDELLYCRWGVSVEGYKIISAKTLDGQSNSAQRMLTPIPKQDDMRVYNRIYDPLAEPKLFRDFAELDLKYDCFVEFANQYGMLTRGFQLDLFPPGYGEPLELWTREVHTMKHALKDWLRVRSGDISALRKTISIQQPVKNDQEFIRKVERSTQKTINKHMNGLVSPRIFRQGDRLNLYFAPDNLLGALWFQFAKALTGNYQFKKCRNWNCKNILFTSSDNGKDISDVRRDWSVSRSDKETCSIKCRQAISWQRKRVLRMVTSGLSHRKIASTLMITLSEVLWLLKTARIKPVLRKKRK